MSKLFTPTLVGPYRLSHRVVMAPLTRMRSEAGDIPGDLMVKYYTQRASDGGLIVSEASPVSIRGNGYAGAPGIYSDTQIAESSPGQRGASRPLLACAPDTKDHRRLSQIQSGGTTSH